MSAITFTIPGQPVAKSRPRFARRGNFVTTYTPERTANFESLVKLAAGQAMAGATPIEQPVSLTLQLHLQIPASWSKKRQEKAAQGLISATRRPDIDNYGKAVLDACNGILWIDDAQVVRMTIEKLYSHAPRSVVTVEALSMEAA